MKIDKLIYPATILISSIIIGGCLYAVQVNKQNSIEKQKKLELEQKQAELEYKYNITKTEEIKRQEQKKECGLMFDSIDRRLKENKTNNSEETILEIFYSPKENSCLYISLFGISLGPNFVSAVYTLKDAYTNSTILSEKEGRCMILGDLDCQSWGVGAKDRFDNRVLEYR